MLAYNKNESSIVNKNNSNTAAKGQGTDWSPTETSEINTPDPPVISQSLHSLQPLY